MKTHFSRFLKPRPRLFWRLSLAFTFLTLLLGGGMFLTWQYLRDVFGPAMNNGTLVMGSCVEDLGQYYADHGDWAGVTSVLTARVCQPGWLPGSNNRHVLILADETGKIIASGGAAFEGNVLSQSENAQALPVLANHHLVGLLYTDQSQNWGELFFTRMLRIGALLVLITLIAGIIFSRQISNPIANLTRASEAIAAGDLHTRVKVSGRDEERNLALAFNKMADQVEQTILSLRQFVSDAAHEINTPLMALRTNLELAPKNEAVANALLQVERLEKMAAGLLDLSRIEGRVMQEPFADIPLIALTEEVCEIYASRAEQLDLDFKVSLPETAVIVHGDAEQLRRVICNLLDNAIKFTPRNGKVALTLQTESEEAVMVIQDNGIGIPSDDLPHLFERFHRGLNTGDTPGNGLGLAIVKAILEKHGGKIQILSADPGVRVILRLPLVHQ